MIPGERYDFNPYDGSRIEDNAAVAYASLQRAKNGDFVVPAYLSSSDYSDNDGGIVRANVNVFTERFAEAQSRLWWPTYGGHGTFGVLIRVDADEDEEFGADILEFVERLETYPIADEDEHSRIQMELEEEQWPDGLRELQRLLEGEFVHEDDIEKVGYDTYRLLAEYYNVYPEVEGSGDNLHVVWGERHIVDSLRLDADFWENYERRDDFLDTLLNFPSKFEKLARFARVASRQRRQGFMQVVEDFAEENGVDLFELALLPANSPVLESLKRFAPDFHW